MKLVDKFGCLNMHSETMNPDGTLIQVCGPKFYFETLVNRMTPQDKFRDHKSILLKRIRFLVEGLSVFYYVSKVS
jgi:hypothetical protein